MDPLLLEALRFGLAILAGGLVGVITQRLAFRDATQLERRRGEERDARLRTALVAEVRENMQRLGGPDPTAAPAVPIIRIAWDGARALAMTVDAFDALARAYAAGEQLSRAVELVSQRAMSARIVVSRQAELETHQRANEILRRDAGIVFGLFRVALEQLGEPLLQIATPRVLDDESEGR